MNYNRGDFTGQDLSTSDISGEVEGSCFHQEQPNTECFPADCTATFINCNLANCKIPAGCTVIGGCNNQLVKQNDLEYWVVDSGTLNPAEPIHKKQYLALGLSIDPANIPESKLDESVIDTKIKEA